MGMTSFVPGSSQRKFATMHDGNPGHDRAGAAFHRASALKSRPCVSRVASTQAIVMAAIAIR
jgi:hypothetical protein